MRVASGVAAVLFAWFGAWVIWYGVREWRNTGVIRLSERLRSGASWEFGDESLAATDRGGVFLGLIFVFLAIVAGAVSLGGRGLGKGTALATVWGSAARVGLAGFIVCGGVYGLITSFNRPKFLVPPQHRGEPGAIAGRRRRRREGVPLRNASGAPGAVDRATFERPVAGEEPSAAVPDNPAMIMVERRVTGGKRDSQRNYLVIVDGRRVATVRGGQTAEVRVSPGRHDVLLKMNWCTSPTLVIDARPGAIVRLACEPGGPDAVPLRDMAVNRKSYINLFRV